VSGTRRWIATAVIGALSACAVGPDYETPEPPDVDAFGGAGDGIATAAQVEQAWWSQLEEAQLDALILEAFSANHDLRIARANLAAARALLSEGRYDYFPTVTAEGSVARQRNSADAFGSDVPIDAQIETFYDAGLDATWELDFFGRVRRANEALAAEYRAAAFDQRFVYVTIAAEVARTYLELRGAQFRLQVARQNAENQRQTYELTVSLLEGGRGTELDLARAEAQLQTTLATIPPLESEVARATHRLAVLTGRPPAALDELLAEPEPDEILPALPELVGVGDPAALLRRRPDIHAAEQRLAAATARIGVSVADLFPRVTLAGSAGYLATDLDALGESRTERFSIGPTISWAAFDLGRVRARIRAAEAEADGLLAAYERTVLTALEETENALVRFGRARERQLSIAVASRASARAAELARLRYRNGVDSFLNVLDAEQRLLDAQDQSAVAETESALALVAVYKALGGGWEAAPNP